MKNDLKNSNEPIELIKPIPIQWEIFPEMTLAAKCTVGRITRCDSGTE